MKLRACDVLVVGAGPGGSVAARFAAEQGAKVIIVERRARVGAPVHCAEHVPLPTLAYLSAPQQVIVQRVAAMHTHVPGQPITRSHSPGVIVDRERFDQQLAEQAERAGATLMTGTRALAMRGDRVLMSAADERFEVQAKIFIGADGPRSRMREWSGGGVARFVHTAQLRMPLRRPLDTVECLFRRWLAMLCTRPDVSYALSVTSRYQSNPMKLTR